MPASETVPVIPTPSPSTASPSPSEQLLSVASYRSDDTSINPVKPSKGVDALPSVTKSVPVWIVYACLVSTQLVFSGWHCVGKYATNNANAVVFALYREALACIMMVILARVIDGRFVWIQKADIGWFFLMGFFSFGNVVGFILALSLTTASNCSILQPTIPVFTALLAYLLGYEGINWKRVVGVFLAVAGAVTIVVFQLNGMSEKAMTDLIWANALLVAQCFCVAANTIVQKKVIKKNYPTTTIATWYYLIGSGFTVFASLYYVDRDSHFWLLTSPGVWGGLAYVSILATMYNYCILCWCNSKVPATTVNIFNTIQPFSTSILGLLFLSEEIIIWQVLAGLLIIAGLLLTIKYPPPVPNNEAARAAQGGNYQQLPQDETSVVVPAANPTPQAENSGNVNSAYVAVPTTSSDAEHGVYVIGGERQN